MNGKIKFAALILAALCMTGMWGCEKEAEESAVIEESEKVYEFDIDALAGEIVSNVKFDDEMVKLSDESAGMRYPFGAEKTVAYAGSGATAEVVIVCSFADSESADKSIEAVNAYLDSQIVLFTDYNVDELPKLEKAFVSVYGRYLVCVVASDVSGVDGICG